MDSLQLETVLSESDLDRATRRKFDVAISQWSDLSDEARWRAISRKLLTPQVPFDVHQRLFAWTYRDRSPEAAPSPAWIPEPADRERSNLARLMRERACADFAELHAWSVSNRGEFWEAVVQALQIPFRSRHTRIASDIRSPQPEWLVDARMNIAEACFQADPRCVAIVYREEGARELVEWSYEMLAACSRRVAAAIRRLGFEPGTAVGLVLPLNPFAVASYLGIILAGCTAVCIADSFAPAEMQRRLEIGNAQLVIAQDELLRAGRVHPLYAKLRDVPLPVVVIPRKATEPIALRGEDLEWSEFIADVEPASTHFASPGEPTTVLFSSGTTGTPKAIPWDHTTPLKCASDAWLHHDVHPEDRLAWPTSMGWMMGPWLIFAGLVNRASIALYEGGPATHDFCSFVEQARVTMLGVVPSLVRSWREAHAIDSCDWSGIRLFSTTGECSRPDDVLYLMSRAGYRPVIEYCGGTELGGGYITGSVLHPCAPSTFSTPALGLDLKIESDSPAAAARGEAFIVPPSIGLSSRLLNGDHQQIYYPESGASQDGAIALRRHGDELERLPGGYFRVHGRIDDCMNLGGVKVAAVEIESVVNEVDGVAASAAIAVQDAGGGPSRLVVFVVPHPDRPELETLRKRMQRRIKERLNPLFKIYDVVEIESIPRTASNKTIRRELRAAYEGRVSPKGP